MKDEQHEELASLYALELLEGSERADFERELAANEGLQGLVAQLRETTSQLAYTAGPASPPAALRERILATISQKSPAKDGSRTAAMRPAAGRVIPFRPLLWAGWGLAASFALVAAWYGQRSFSTHRELLNARNAIAFEQAGAKSLQNQLEAERLIASKQANDLKTYLAELDKNRQALISERLSAARQLAELQGRYDLANFKVARLASLLGNTPEAAAIAVWNPQTQEGVLTVEKLPALASNQDYQLWVIDPQYTNPVDGGVFTVDPTTGIGRLEFRPRQPVAQATKFAISRERKGGVPKAEGPIVLLSL